MFNFSIYFDMPSPFSLYIHPCPGVIVLVFILCWLPFHISRTIVSFSLGSAVGGQDGYMGTNTDTHVVDNDTSSIVQTGDRPPYTVTEAHTEKHFNMGRVAEMHVKDRHADTTPGAAYTTLPTAAEVSGGYNLQNTTINYGMHTQVDPYVLYYLTQYFNLVSFVLFYLSAAINPLLYNLMSARYRQAVRSLMHTLVHTRTGSGSGGHTRALPTLQSTTTM